MSRSFLDASIPCLVTKLTIDEKISLLGAPNWWNTSAIERLEIPAVRMSDGPNVRCPYSARAGHEFIIKLSRVFAAHPTLSPPLLSVSLYVLILRHLKTLL